MVNKPTKNSIDPKKMLLVTGPALVLITAISLILILGKNREPELCIDDLKYFAKPDNFPKIDQTNLVRTYDYYLDSSDLYLKESLFKNPEVFYDTNGEVITNGGTIRDAYASKHALNKIDSSFKKISYNQLFDGYIACAYAPNSYVYLLEEGVTIDMKRKIQTYDNVVFDYGFSTSSYNMDVTVSFYKNVSDTKEQQYEEYAFHFSNILNDKGGGLAYMISFYPDDVMNDGNSLVDCSIMSYRYVTNEQLITYEEAAELEYLEGIKFLKMYEWLMPNSTWKK